MNLTPYGAHSHEVANSTIDDFARMVSQGNSATGVGAGPGANVDTLISAASALLCLLAMDLYVRCCGLR